jgi:hypothetical protein
LSLCLLESSKAVFPIFNYLWDSSNSYVLATTWERNFVIYFSFMRNVYSLLESWADVHAGEL